jgi:TrmH family RNA methyltransferase
MRSAIVPQCYPSCVIISSRQNPIVARYRAAAHGEAAGILLLDGTHLVDEALAAGLTIRAAAITTTAEDDDELRSLVDALRRAGVEVVTATTAVMDALSPVRSSSAIVALADRPDADADGLYGGAAALVVIAIDVQDPGNLGAIVRVAEAGGATAVVAAGACADPFGWKALRGSMGSALRLPIGLAREIDGAIAAARSAGCRIVATAPRGGRSLFELPLTEPTAVLVGGEGRGLPLALLEAADERVSIPMEEAVESLNTAVTAALLVYEARRQRSRLEL